MPTSTAPAEVPANLHQAEATCGYAGGFDAAAPGDLVRMCTAQAAWRVRQRERDGRVTVDPQPGPGWTWRTPLTVTTEHLDLVERTAGVLW